MLPCIHAGHSFFLHGVHLPLGRCAPLFSLSCRALSMSIPLRTLVHGQLTQQEECSKGGGHLQGRATTWATLRGGGRQRKADSL